MTTEIEMDVINRDAQVVENENNDDDDVEETSISSGPRYNFPLEVKATDVKTTEDVDLKTSDQKQYEQEERKINSKNITLWGKTTQKMGVEAKKVLLSSYPDAGSIRYKGIELGVIKKKKKEDMVKLV